MGGVFPIETHDVLLNLEFPYVIEDRSFEMYCPLSGGLLIMFQGGKSELKGNGASMQVEVLTVTVVENVGGLSLKSARGGICLPIVLLWDSVRTLGYRIKRHQAF